VRANLDDAVKVIALMLDRAKVVQTESTELVTLVVDKAGTDDGSVGSAPSTPPAPPAAKPEPRPPAPRPAPRPATPAPAAPAPPPPPAPPAAPPPPKPAPKSADFEP
jgi:hypothetical protein